MASRLRGTRGLKNATDMVNKGFRLIVTNDVHRDIEVKGRNSEVIGRRGAGNKAEVSTDGKIQDRRAGTKLLDRLWYTHLLPVVRPALPSIVDELVGGIPISACVVGAGAIGGEVPRGEVAGLECQVCGAERPQAEVDKTMVDVTLLDRVEAMVVPCGQRAPHDARAVQLVEHSDCEGAVFLAEADVVVADGTRPEPFLLRFGVEDGVANAVLHRDQHLLLLDRQIVWVVATDVGCLTVSCQRAWLSCNEG